MRNKIITGGMVLLLIAGAWAGISVYKDKSALVENKVSDDKNADVRSGEVRYFGETKGYLARPEGGSDHPGIILIHEWWGLNQNMKDMADQFANEGYVALAVDLYNGKLATDPKMAGELAGGVRANMEPAFNNLRAAVDYLRSLPEVDENRLASIGWCFGGGWSYQMAKNNLGVKASVMYYGQFNTEDDLSEMKAHISGHFGEKDMSIKADDVHTFQATLKTLSGDHEVFIYPNAGHGFANPDNQNYSAEAAGLAWGRTLAFLDEHLSKEAARVIKVDGFNFAFSPTDITVNKGERVKIVLTNTGGWPHDFVIDEFNVGTPAIKVGESTEVTFVPDKVGVFEYYCSVGNHRAMGMKGVLTVR